jgi:hypothetical protein
MTTMRHHATRLRRSHRRPYLVIRTLAPTLVALILLALVFATR